jgi:hypothetical protein
MAQFRVSRLDRNHKSEVDFCFVRAETQQQAKRIAESIIGGRSLVAVPYRPEKDPAFSGYVFEASDK